MYIFQFFTSRKPATYQVIWSVVVSYILKAFCSLGHNFLLKEYVFSWELKAIILSVLALLFSIIFVFISETSVLNRLTTKINSKTVHDDIWQDVIDYKNGTTLRFILDDLICCGILVAHEEKGNDSWFVLKDYVITENGKTLYAEDLIDREINIYDCMIAINMKDVKRVELFYGKPKETLITKARDFIGEIKEILDE